MQQRVQRQCCTRGRSRPAHPRHLAGVRMRDVPARRFVCARCRAPVLVCSHCDRGQIYCAGGCSATARQLRQRDAARRYQDSLRGRFKHAARTQRWRGRQAVLAISAATSAAQSVTQSVTHQGSTAPASDAVLSVPSPMPAAAAAPAPASPVQPCKIITTRSACTAVTAASPATGDPALAPAVTSPLTLPTWRCRWCHTPCAARVRLGFLRHSRPARKASARVEPSHGHSP
jgi:hypothetical protein